MFHVTESLPPTTEYFAIPSQSYRLQKKIGSTIPRTKTSRGFTGGRTSEEQNQLSSVSKDVPTTVLLRVYNRKLM